ncbi:MAG: hypothetical protein AAGF87_12535, partial [Bacteroidota bacterium]
MLDHRQGELIVDLLNDIDGKSWCSAQPGIISFKRLSAPLNIWLLNYDHQTDSEQKIWRQI